MSHKILKDNTRAEHDKTEDLAFSKEIMQGTLNLEKYKTLLRSNYIFNNSLEINFKNSDYLMKLEGLEMPKRFKAISIKRDLSAIGEEVLEHSFKLGESPYFLLGAMYVAEGSTLGGSVIARKLKECADLSALPNSTFYGFYGQETGILWKQFVAILDRELNDDAKANEALEGAKAAFNLFSTILAAETEKTLV